MGRITNFEEKAILTVYQCCNLKYFKLFVGSKGLTRKSEGESVITVFNIQICKSQ